MADLSIVFAGIKAPSREGGLHSTVHSEGEQSLGPSRTTTQSRIRAGRCRHRD